MWALLHCPLCQSKFEWGRPGVTLPTVDNLVVLASVFDVPMETILVIEVEQ